MKKIRLNVADLDATEVLSRDQLKSIFGGSSSGSGGTIGCGAQLCNSNSDCSKNTQTGCTKCTASDAAFGYYGTCTR
ncbi:MAG: hypothetical protein H6Q14_999 [Bacteroidetes bacterium]|nr:hypothetical protein [Bacteroidota bacterium]